MIKSGPISRFSLIGGALSLAGLFILGWLIRIQISDAANNIPYDDYSYDERTIYPERGGIYDRWNHLLAGNKEVYELGVDMRYVTDPQTIALTVSSLLELDYDVIYRLLTEKPEEGEEMPVYITLSKSVDPEKIDELKENIERLDEQAARVSAKKRQTMPNLNGLTWSPTLQRSYPEGSLASNMLGFYPYLDRETGRGYFGIEEKYDGLLAGKPILVRDPVNPYLIDKASAIPSGGSLVLTIDREIQSMVERILDDAVENSGSESGTIIIMDPRNGEILAMSSTPRLDPNKYWEYAETFPGATPFNRAIGQTYEPGSVFKVLTMAAAMDAGIVTPDTEFLDTGSITVGGIALHNWDGGAWGPQTMLGCMQHSLNVCLAWVATELGPSNFYSYMQKFGIGHLTGIDLAGEANFPLTTHGDPYWYPVNLGTNSYGQGVATTPIQMITAVSAVANNSGIMYRPHILRYFTENGEETLNPPQPIGSPIKAETAKTLSDMLAVSLEEESSDALVEGYKVAGKTGTGSIPTKDGYTINLTNASFVGWGPVDDPRFIVYVWLEKPQSSIWGSKVAAPVFRDVVKELVVLLDLPPDTIRQQLANQFIEMGE